jgi:hypothetical protein
MALAKKVLRYLQGRKRIPLRWCARSCQQPHLPGHIYGYADASFADIKPDRLSSMGYVFIINNGAVSWRSTRTPLVTLSAAESEVIALSAATQEAVYLRKLANELGFTQTSPTTLYEDCTAAVALSKENRFRNRSKHIALRWSFVSERQHPSVGDIQVISVSRKIMLADIFASPRPAASFIPFRDSLLGRTSRISPLDSRDASTPDDDAVLRGARTFMVKVKAHRGEPLNERADTQAENARQMPSECRQWTTRTERMTYEWSDSNGVKHVTAWSKTVRKAMLRGGAEYQSQNAMNRVGG